MSGGFRSVIAGVLGRFSSTPGTPPPPVTDIPKTDWFRFSELPIEQNRNLSAINFNNRALDVGFSESELPIEQNRKLRAVNFNNRALIVNERDSDLPIQQNRPRNGVNSS